MGNCKFTFMDVTNAMIAKRKSMSPPTTDWKAEAQRLREKLGLASLVPVSEQEQRPERSERPERKLQHVPPLGYVPPSRTPKCYVHAERWFTFSDGTTWVRCSHCECTLGIDRKTHSDRTPSGTIYFIAEDFKHARALDEVALTNPNAEEDPGDETGADREEELNVLPPEPTRIAGDESEEEAEVEPEESDEVCATAGGDNGD